MPRFLLLKLDGVMQGWGGHTYEDWRPTELFPTRSALLGLLGACLGLDRQNSGKLNDLAGSVTFTIRSDYRTDEIGKRLRTLRLCDYHTIQDARKVDGKPNKNPVQSYRWYLFDSLFTVAVEETKNATITLDVIEGKIRKPVYTPFLGRRSCSLNRPLLDSADSPAGKIIEAASAKEVLALSGGEMGTVLYTECKELSSNQILRVRDVPVYGKTRKFTTRDVYVHAEREAE
jgi:CRISPR system Cascade subunit CasD